jgi:hypothetical protein
VGAVAAAEAAAAQAAQAAQLAMAAAVAAAAAATQAAVDFGAPWATSRTPAKPTAFDDAAFAQAAAASAAASEAQQAAARAEKAQEGIEDLRLSIRLAEEEREREALWEGATPNRFHTRGCPDDEDGAATAMQRRWRGERARRLVQELREYLALTAQLARWRRREAAALVIQSWTRGMHARIEYRSRYDAVIKLQAGMRGALARRRARTRRLEVAAEKAEAERLAAEAATAAAAAEAERERLRALKEEAKLRGGSCEEWQNQYMVKMDLGG